MSSIHSVNFLARFRAEVQQSHSCAIARCLAVLLSSLVGEAVVACGLPDAQQSEPRYVDEQRTTLARCYCSYETIRCWICVGWANVLLPWLSHADGDAKGAVGEELVLRHRRSGEENAAKERGRYVLVPKWAKNPYLSRQVAIGLTQSGEFLLSGWIPPLLTFYARVERGALPHLQPGVRRRWDGVWLSSTWQID